MTALLTDNLPLLAGASNGIKKLRELILELAVRGKLVPQDPNDEPASELLKRIAEEKARLVSLGRLKKQKSLLEMTGEEPFQVPSDWEWCKLSELLPDFQNGASSRGDSSGITVTVLRLADIKSGEISLEDTRSLTLEEATISKYCLESGDILLIRVNGSADLVGRFIVCRTELQAIPCDHFIRMRFPQDIICSAYLKIVGDGAIIRSTIASLFLSTTGQKTVNQGHVGSLPIPLPPLAQQHRIVAKVDELMTLCDRLEAQHADAESAHAQLVQALLDSLTQASDATDFAASWERLAEHFHTLFTTEPSIDALKKSLLQLAVMGKLVPQDPTDEPASELLKRISVEKTRLVAEGRIKKPKPMTEITEEEKPFELPAGWEWSQLGQVSSDVQYGFTASANHQKGEPLFLRITDIQNDGVNWDSVPGCDISPAEIAGYELKDGDIVIARTGGTIGKSYLVSGLTHSAVFASYLIRIGCLDSIYPDFTKVFLSSQFYWDQLYANSMGTGQPNVNGTALKGLLFPLAPMAEQHRIVAKVDQLMALCDQLKLRLTQARQLNEQLASTLVEQAVA
ncbi:restriction endonuclease subunit S [Pseudomonas sp. BE134]|uniref:restriction endonuclease subunit S n=1 Tax=Pseudomonas sp. BE134 TaxID=2817843 RepID=UPI002862C4AE|nr:restriction endonuclease subunit S [Pseudomonas sp. BE134]MDR6928285.1 type I restriction enzyme S subunit [Pseudomonas sp. BE134]